MPEPKLGVFSDWDNWNGSFRDGAATIEDIKNGAEDLKRRAVISSIEVTTTHRFSMKRK